MRESRVYTVSQDDFKPTREDLTTDIRGLQLIPEGLSASKVVLTQVGPGGEFSVHVDDYHHVFYCISGKGMFRLDGNDYKFCPGMVVEVVAGTPHGYKNMSDRSMVLITVNVSGDDLDSD